ncbi:MAG: HD domain-containing protein [Chloroflexi bacterium]|nr:HD domain-containing protein [Chloroflexota bacterium]MBI3339522.1 HD domain-containing protein [Chloroflexota bacterium]
MMDDKAQNISPYLGRWVARLRGKIIASGGTPEQALRAAQKSRHKETPEIIYMSFPFAFPPLLNSVCSALPDAEIYLVGGAMRDILLNRVSHDLDFAVPKNAIATARRVASALKTDFFVLDESLDTARLIVSTLDGVRDILDFAAFRGPSLDSDLRGRDFTINAIAFDLRQQTILDPLNGAADLRAKKIRACSETSLQDDPIRILRAVRQAAAFGFKIEPETRNAMKAAVNLLPNISAERQRDELFKILEGPRPDASLRALEMLGVFPHLLPELTELKGVSQSAPHIYDVWEHTLSVIQHLDGLLADLAPGYSAEKTNDILTGLLTLRLGRYRQQIAEHFTKSLNADRSLRALLFFAALYHDISKPATRSVDESGRIRFFDHDQLGAKVISERARLFNLSNDEIERLQTIIQNHMRFHFFVSRMEGGKKEPSRKAIYRFFRESGEGGVDLVLLGLADLRGTRGHTLNQETWAAALDVARILLENYWEKPQETVAPPRLVDGHDAIKEYNMKQGPLVGLLLEAIREAQAMGKVSTRAEAIEFGRAWVKENQK